MFKIGNKISVDWILKVNGSKFPIDASLIKWNNVTIKNIKHLSREEVLIFTNEWPLCPVRIERCKLV